MRLNLLKQKQQEFIKNEVNREAEPSQNSIATNKQTLTYTAGVLGIGERLNKFNGMWVR